MKAVAFWIALCLAGGVAAQDIKAVTAAAIKAGAQSVDTVYVVNFWATWCQPCVQELPAFNELYQKYGTQPVRILLVSLDFKADYPYKLQGFVQRKHLLPEVAWLSETDPNVFIPVIDESWQGSIPATLVIRPGKGRKFMEGQLNYRALSKAVDALLGN
ncbi:MAG: TlpA family protein disulfide reductase [Chitinophagia bacterium]|nr:TlpA family protein disulfide reductase [Chitinophagia bacterium]